MDQQAGRQSRNHCSRTDKSKKKGGQPKRPLEQHQAYYICIIGVPEGEEREKGPEKIFEEIIVENSPNMGKEIATQVQESAASAIQENPRGNMPRDIVIKLAKIKDKEKLLKPARVKLQITYKGTPIKLTADFSAETLQARTEWHDILKMMKGKKVQQRLL